MKRSFSQRRRDEVAADVRRLRRNIRGHRESAAECARKGYADLVATFEGLAVGAREAAKAWLRYGRHFTKGGAVKRLAKEPAPKCRLHVGGHETQPGLHTPNGLRGDGCAHFHAKSTPLPITGIAEGNGGAR